MVGKYEPIKIDPDEHSEAAICYILPAGLIMITIIVFVVVMVLME
jgi:hypothetical protein